MSAKDLKHNLRFLRKKSNFTQCQFSDLIDIPLKRYQSWEEGRAEPCIDNLISIAEVSNISLDELLIKDLAKSN